MPPTFDDLGTYVQGSDAGFTPGATTGRNITFHGKDALDWLFALGLDSETDEKPTIRIDVNQDGHFGYARARHTGMTSRLRDFGDANVIMMFLVLQGSVEVTGEDGSIVSVGVGDSYAYPSSANLVQRNEGFVDKVGVMMEAGSTRMAAMPGLTLVRRGDDGGVSRVLAGLVIGLLETDRAIDDPRSPHIQLAVENATIALYETALRSQWAHASGPQRLVASARQLIADRDVTERFTVETLAKAECVSTGYLRRAFAAEGTTPLAALTKQRLQRANAMLNDSGLRNGRSSDEVAKASGFSSAASMRRAMKKDALNHD